MAPTIDDYLKTNHAVVVTRDPESGAWLVEVPDWPGCMSDGATVQEAFDNLYDAKHTWVEDCLERGLTVPAPRPAETHSGKFVLRIPRSLHRRLVRMAEVEGVSLNSYVTTALAEHVGTASASIMLATVRDEAL